MVKGGLRLKQETVASAAQKPIGELTVAQVWVDASVYHLDSEFSYLIPGNLSRQVEIGSMVSLPFHGRDIIGVVVDLIAPESTTGLKSINKVIGSISLLTPAILSLIKQASDRYACHPFDLLRSAIPDRVAMVEKEFIGRLASQLSSSATGVRQYLQLPPAQYRSKLLAEKVLRLLDAGSALIVLPDSREVSSLAAELSHLGIDFVILDSALPKSELFRNFLRARLGDVRVVIGTRSAIFAPVAGLASILIYNEGSENLYERRSPGWNTRDIAFLRSQSEKADLFFVGYSPSSEIARFVDEEWIDLKRVKARVNIQLCSQVTGELLPSRSLSPIKKALTAGPVLFLVPLRGYAQAIRCHKCRTISRCQCGGAHEKLALNLPITCNHCLTKIEPWQCIWCNGVQPSMQSRGIERHSQELGKLFPGVPTQLSTGEHPINEVSTHAIVIATPGMAPRCRDGYSAVVILEGNQFLNQPDMRAAERIREMYFAHAALARNGAPVILVQDEGDQISTALATWNPTVAISRELEERRSLHLPPYVRAALMTMDLSEIVRFKGALLTAQSEGRLPESTRILGPIPGGEKASIILTVDISEGESLISTLHEFMRRRSAAKKSLPSLRIDPYSLSR